MIGETEEPNGMKIVACVIGLLIGVGGGVYSMVELRVSPVVKELEALRELTDYRIKDLKDELDKLIAWRNSWVQRVLQLDEQQNGKHVASEQETQRLRAFLGLP